MKTTRIKTVDDITLSTQTVTPVINNGKTQTVCRKEFCLLIEDESELCVSVLLNKEGAKQLIGELDTFIQLPDKKHTLKEYFTFDEAQAEIKGKPFRLPTKQEFQNLLKNEHFFKDGKLFVVSDGVSLVLPAKGYRYHSDGLLRHSGDCGCYWSSSSNSQSTRWGLNFTSSYAGWDFDGKNYGFALRCVSDSPLEGFVRIGNLYWATENYSK
jgi:hypothetical protein